MRNSRLGCKLVSHRPQCADHLRMKWRACRTSAWIRTDATLCHINCDAPNRSRDNKYAHESPWHALKPCCTQSRTESRPWLHKLDPSSTKESCLDRHPCILHPTTRSCSSCMLTSTHKAL